MATVEAPREQRFLMRNVNWQEYRGFADLLGEWHVRLTYDRGRLEFMTLSHLHELLKKLLAQFVEALTEELDRPRQSAGSTTLDREVLDRGVEPDECFYLDNEPLIRGKDEIDLDVDPPPDLALEIEVSRSALDRLGIYAALRVPEVWRYDGTTLRVYRLTETGEYCEADRSRHFPFLPPGQLEGFLQRRNEMDETSLVKAFRRWVRDQIAQGWSAS